MLWMFSFRGRINRLQYFLGSAGLGAGLAVMLFVAGAIALAVRGGMMGVLVAALMLIALLVASFWSSLSMRARRIRDIGWPVLPVMGGSLLLTALNISLSLDATMSAYRAQASGLLPTPHVSPLGGMLSLIGLVLDLCLLFWPGKPGDDPLETGWREPTPVARPYDAMFTRKAAGAAPAPMRPMAANPAPTATGGFPRAQTQAGFGRRGA